MLKALRRILAVIAILIALSVLVPLAYIEGTCRPSSGALAASAPTVTLPAIDEPGYRRKLNNTFFTFPEWYIVYSFEDFGRFLDRSSESRFNYLGHIFGFWQSFCTINRAVPATAESLTEVKTMIYVIGISYSAEYAIKGFLREHRWARVRMDQGREAHTAGRVRPRGAAGLCRLPLHHPLVQISVSREARRPDGDLCANAEQLAQLGARLALGAEYFVKIGYAALIQKALDAGGDEEPRDIMFVVAALPPPQVLAKEPRIKPIRALNAHGSWCRRRATRR
jgi:hypothetical protein